jgi:hypothetical protein
LFRGGKVMNEEEMRKKLLRKVKAKRSSIGKFIEKEDRLGSWLITGSIVCTGAATFFTGSEATGISWLGERFRSTGLIIAAVCSTAAFLMTGFHKQRGVASRLRAAQDCNTNLECLELKLTLGTDCSLKELEAMVDEFKGYTKLIYFIPDTASSLDRLEGTIDQPIDNQVVGGVFTCSGSINGYGEGVFLWLAVATDGKIWPKERPIPVVEDGPWEIEVKDICLKGPTEKFSLALYAADEQADRRIKKWIDHGRRTGNYPGIQGLEGLVWITEVSGLCHESASQVTLQQKAAVSQ